jgi:DNA-binding transcriptional LysR family regulator
MDIDGRLTLKQLRAFVSVYRHRKLVTAAEELRVTQSAISVLIRQIESTLGIRLFDRNTRSLEPTLAATEVFGIAERVLQEVGTLVFSAREMTAGVRGRVHLAATPSTAAALLATTVGRFSREYERIRLILDDCAPNQFLSLIQSEQVEFGVGTPPPTEAGFESTPLLEDRMYVVCADSHAIARQAAVSWKDLNGVPVIAFRPGYGVRRLIDDTAAKAGIELNIVHEAGFLDTAAWMAASGLGVCLLPGALARKHAHQPVAIVPLRNPVVRRTIALVTKKGRSLSPACRIFVDMLRSDLAADQASGTGATHP